MSRARTDRRRATVAAAADDAVEESDLDDPTPDVHELFRHYDALYFRGALRAAGFAVKWGSPPVSSSFGSCTFSKPSNTITLSEPVLQYRSCADLKNALLHEMIHAIIYLKHHRKDCATHGPVFRDWMNAINSCCIKDPQRPVSGYNITTRHDFKPERSLSFKGILWQCKICGDTLPRATNVGAPSDACCIENVTDQDATCGNMLCPWHNHKSECRGAYESTGFQSFEAVQNKVPKGTQLLLTYNSETSKSKGAIQESNSAELQENTEVTEQNAEDEHVSLNSLMKKAKRRRSEVVQEAIVLAVELPKEMKREQALVAMEKLRHYSTVGCNDARSLEVGTSKKTGKQHKPEDVQKPNAAPATDLGKPQLNQQLVPTERHKLFSFEGCSDGKPVESSSLQKTGKRQRSEVVDKASILPDEPPKEMKQALIPKEGCNDAKTLGSTNAEKILKQHKTDGVQRPSAPPSTSQGKPKLRQEFVTTDMQKLLSLEACNYAKSPGSSTSKQDDDQHKPTSAQKACSQHAYSLRRLKKDPVALEKNELIHSMGSNHGKLLDKSSSKKTRKRNEPEDIQETTMLQTVPRHIPKKSSSAPRKQQRKCRRQPARKKEYAVVSLWMNIYESDRSSGSTEPLVNKRTERRKRERERIQATANSPPPLDNSWMDVSVSSHKMGKDESALESRPSSPYCNAVVPSTVQQVVTRAAGHSQTSAPCLAVVPLQPADAPLDSVPLDSAIIDISDDD